jgi:hypothetical protein
MEKVYGTKEFVRLMTDAIFDKIEDEEEGIEHMTCFMLKLNESIKKTPKINAVA